MISLNPTWLRDLAKRVWGWFRRSGCRRGEALGLALLGVCAAGSQAAPGSEEQTKRITISLGADDVEYRDDDQTVTLMGQVHLHARGLPGAIGEVQMESDRLTVALGPGDVSSEGRTLVRAQGLEISGEAVRYNLRSHACHAQEARSAIVVPIREREVTVFARSQLIESDGTQAELHRARVTTCERERPHYALHVRRATVAPSRDRLTIRGGAIELYGIMVPLIPKFNKSLGLQDEGAELDLALPGYSATDGWYYPVTTRFTDPDAPLQARINLRLAQNSLIAGRAMADYTRGGLHTWIAAIRRDQRTDDITGRLLYSALPEIGVRMNVDRGSSAASVELTGGYYREQDLVTRRRATDVAATLKLTWDWKSAGGEKRTGVRAGVGARTSLYAAGSSYRTAYLHCGGKWNLWGHAVGGLGLRHNFVGGYTPFEFDDVDIRTEAFGELTTPLLGPWGLSLAGRYDLNKGALRDYDIGLIFQHHCLTWMLQYNGAHDRVGIGVNLADFTFGGRPRPVGAPKGTISPRVVIGDQPLQRMGLQEQPEVCALPESPLTVVPTEYALSRDHRQRAPSVLYRAEFAPPPSLRVASAIIPQ